MALITAPSGIAAEGPLVFLAGPILWGADEWHDRALACITELDPRIHVASPRRDRATSARLWNIHEDATKASAQPAFPEREYDEQLEWETRNLRRAGEHGAVLFWLARERTHACERPHAQTTRFELGEWTARHMRDGAHLVVGIERGFSGERYIRGRFARDCPRVPICSSLDGTCRAAVALCSARLHPGPPARQSQPVR